MWAARYLLAIYFYLFLFKTVLKKITEVVHLWYKEYFVYKIMKYYELRINSALTQPLLNLSLNNSPLALGWKSFSHCSPVVEWGSVKHTYQSRISLHLQKILSQPKLSKVWHKWGKKKKLCSDSFNCKGTFGNWHSYVIEPLVLEEKLRFFEDFFFFCCIMRKRHILHLINCYW